MSSRSIELSCSVRRLAEISRVPNSRTLSCGITPPVVRIEPPPGELIEFVELSRKGVWRNDSHLAICGQMGADSCSSRVALRSLRDRFSGLFVAAPRE